MNNVVRMAKAPLFQIHPTLVASVATFVKYLFCCQCLRCSSCLLPCQAPGDFLSTIASSPFFPFVYQSSTMLPPTPDRPWGASQWRRQQTNRVGARFRLLKGKGDDPLLPKQ